MRVAFLLLLVACQTSDPAPVAPSPVPQLDPQVRYNVDRLNAIRAQRGLPQLSWDPNISSFATTGSNRLAQDHVPHAHFAQNAKGFPFNMHWAENQGDPNGVGMLDRDPGMNTRKQIDLMINMMMSEGPGGGHYDNIVNPTFRRVGIGIVYVGGKMYLTNDFSD